MTATSLQGLSGDLFACKPRRLIPHHLKIMSVPGSRNAFPRRVRPWLITPGGDPLLAQLAHMPVLAISHIPKLNRIIRVVTLILRLGSVGMKIPVAPDYCTLRRLRPEEVHHYIIGMQT